MNDLISRRKALEALTVTEEMGTAELLWLLTTRINDLPSIQSEPKCGRWESIDWANEYFKCSECGRIERWSPNYCATCGAKMATRTLYVRGTPNIIEEPNGRAKTEE